MAAELLNQLSEQDRERILKEMEQRDPVLTETVRRKLFTFEDFLNKDPGELVAFMKTVPRGHLVLALRGLTDEWSQRAKGFFSERGWSELQEEMKAQGPQPISRVEEARKKILELWLARS